MLLLFQLPRACPVAAMKAAQIEQGMNVVHVVQLGKLSDAAPHFCCHHQPMLSSAVCTGKWRSQSLPRACSVRLNAISTAVLGRFQRPSGVDRRCMSILSASMTNPAKSSERLVEGTLCHPPLLCVSDGRTWVVFDDGGLSSVVLAVRPLDANPAVAVACIYWDALFSILGLVVCTCPSVLYRKQAAI